MDSSRPLPAQIFATITVQRPIQLNPVMNDLMFAIQHLGRGGQFFFVLLIVVVIALAFAANSSRSQK